MTAPTLDRPTGLTDARGNETRVKACALEDPDLMFPMSEEPYDGWGRRNTQVDAAKAVCQGCWFRDQCLTEALARREPYGVWGALTTRERESLRRKRYPRRDAERTQDESLFDAEAVSA